MGFATININDGQVSGVNLLSPACSSLINWEIDDAGVNVPRPPLASYSVAGTGVQAAPVTGLFYWSGCGYIIGTHADGKWWAIANGTSTTATPVNTVIADVSAVNPLLPSLLAGGSRSVFAPGQADVYAAAGDQIRRWNPDRRNAFVLGFANPVTAQTLSQSPRCTHIAAIGDRLVANDLDDTSIVRFSNLGEGAWGVWQSGSFFSPSARPDPVVGIYENMNELWVFGSETLQCYQPGTDPTNPYDLISTAAFGLAAPYCVIAVNDSFIFLDDSLRLVRSDRRTETPISDAIQKDLRALTNPADAWGYNIEQGQTSKLVIQFPTDKRSFVYDLKAERWSEQTYYAGSFQGFYPAGAYAYWPTFNRHLVGSSLAAGGLYTIGGATGSDLGNPLVCERVTGWHDHGIQARKRCVRVRATVRRGSGGATAGDNGSYELRIQDDDKPWSQWRTKTIGTPDDYRNVVDFFPGGIYRRRRYHFRFSTSEAAALASAQEEIIELAN